MLVLVLFRTEMSCFGGAGRRIAFGLFPGLARLQVPPPKNRPNLYWAATLRFYPKWFYEIPAKSIALRGVLLQCVEVSGQGGTHTPTRKMTLLSMRVQSRPHKPTRRPATAANEDLRLRLIWPALCCIDPPKLGTTSVVRTLVGTVMAVVCTKLFEETRGVWMKIDRHA